MHAMKNGNHLIQTISISENAFKILRYRLGHGGEISIKSSLGTFALGIIGLCGILHHSCYLFPSIINGEIHSFLRETNFNLIDV